MTLLEKEKRSMYVIILILQAHTYTQKNKLKQY